MLAERSLTVHHFGVLMTLDEVGTGQDQLSALIGVDPRNAVGIIDGLVERGLLAREVAPDDRRRRVIVLTTEGRAMAREVSRASAEVEEQFLSPLTHREQQVLHRLLVKLLRPTILDRHIQRVAQAER
jgi:DNA-binding MarR family transcriptional regulator